MSDKQVEKPKPRPPSSKKIPSDYQKAHKRAELERIRLQKEQERKEKLQEKERQRIEKQQKKEAEEREREAKRLKRKEEQRKRDEEKEAERKKKEEEKRKKEEEKLQREQEKKKEEEFKTKREEKQRAVLLGFLVKGDAKKDNPQSSCTSCGPFIQFELRKDMRMAPLHRVPESLLLHKRTNLDHLFELWTTGSSDDPASSLGLRKFGRTNYLHELKTGQIEPLSCPSTWPTEPPSIQFLGENLCLPMNSPDLKRHGTRGTGGTVWLRAKLFQFCENYRPAYYGTWRRRSRVVTGRRPFAQDKLQLDYTVDSDDEWEEEEPGESITQSENEEEEEEKEEEDDDDDDRFFVPHGYLSDDEGVGAEDGDEEPNAQDMKRLRRCLSAAEYEEAHRRGLQRLKSLLVGPVWLPEPINFMSTSDALDEDKENIEHAPLNPFTLNGLEKNEFNMVRSSLNIYRVHLWSDNIPIPVQLETVNPTLSQRRLKKSLPIEAIPYLIHLVHKSPLGKLKLAFEFRVFWHRHTTGSLPECTQYAEYKKYTSSMNANVNRGPVLSGPAWDNLALSQSLVLTSIAEIALFEEGRWAVHTKVLRKFASKLANLCGAKDLNDSTKLTDPEFLSNFVFPPWQFLSDVVTITCKANRMSSAKRRSLEVPISTEPVLNTKPTGRSQPTQLSSSPLVVLQPINTPTNITTDPRTSDTNKTLKPDSNDSLLKDPPSKLSLESIASNEEVSSPVISARKRVTLESFFTPPPKRSNIMGKTHPAATTTVSTDEITIVLDSD